MAHRPFVQDKASHRPERFAQRVKEELSTMIPGELRDPRVANIGFLTITSVTVTPDLKNAEILFALMGDEDRAREVEAGLNAAAAFLRTKLMQCLNTKVTPHLRFKYDKGLENTSQIDQLLKTLK